MAAVLAATAVRADDSLFKIADGDPAYVTFAAGAFDVEHSDNRDVEVALEYRSDLSWGPFKPFAHASYIGNDMTFVGGGVLADVQIGDNWIVQPSVAATWWRGELEHLDLGYPLQFRTRLEVAYRFPDKSRLGLAVTHSSNANLGDPNPGIESVMLNVSVPTGMFAWPWGGGN